MWAWPFFPPVRGVPGLPGESSSSRSLSAAMAAPSGTCILLGVGGAAPPWWVRLVGWKQEAQPPRV